MKKRIEDFLATATDVATRDLVELKAIYTEITGDKPKCKSESCTSKMIVELRKYYDLNFSEKPLPVRKYELLPGNHSFAPGGPSCHNNDNTTDAEIEEYLIVFPHIKKLLIA